MNKKISTILDSIKDKQSKAKVENFFNTHQAYFLIELEKFKKNISLENEKLNENTSQVLKGLIDGVVFQLEDVTKDLDKRISNEIGKYFRNTNPSVFYSSEIVDKGFKKYRGYPGDFEMMNFVYNYTVCSKTKMGQYWDYYFVNNAYAEAVRGRKNKMVEILIKVLKDWEGDKIRILNLPCGPSRDVQELCAHKDLRKDINIEIVCVDQDIEALEYSKNSIKNMPVNVKVVFQQGSILNYVRHMDKHIDELGKFDFFYSIGIADYLPDKLLKSMILFSWKLLNDKGLITYAFKIKERDPLAPLPPKWFCDWQFVSRNLEESREIMINSGIESYKLLEDKWEDSKRIVFFNIRKL